MADPNAMAPDPALSVVPEIDNRNFSPFRELLGGEDDVDYLSEDSEEARALAAAAVDNTEPPEFAGKTREELLAELQAEKQRLADAQLAAQPVQSLEQTMKAMMGQMAPPKTPVTPGYAVVPAAQQMGDAEFEKWYNETYLENPHKAQKAAQDRQAEQVLRLMAVNQGQLSRELLLANPETRKVYDRYSDEIEQAVAAVPVVERVQNPRVYQTAADLVRARHMSEIVTETTQAQVQELVKAELAKYGIDPSKPPAKPAAGYVAPAATQRPPAGPARRAEVVPTWVEEKADILGVPKEFLYSKYKKEGVIK